MTSQYTNYCAFIECLTPLTPDEIMSHYDMHQQKGTPALIHSIKGTKESCQKKIQAAIEKLQQQVESVDALFLMNPEEMIKNEIKKMDKYKDTMIEMINHYFDAQKDKLQHMVKFNALKVRDAGAVFEEIKIIIKQLQVLNSSLDSPNQLKQINKALRLDVKAMLDKYKSKIKKTFNQKDIVPITVHVNEDKLYQFNSYLDKVIYIISHQEPDQDDQYQIQEPSQQEILQQAPLSQQSERLDLSRQQDPIEQQQNFFTITVANYFEPSAYKFLHYFVSEDLFLYILDITKLPDQRRFSAITLNQNFVIPFFHRSLSTPNGNIFLTGGSINEQEKNSHIYIYNPQKQCLDSVGNLKFPRSSHGMVYCNDYIYILSGFTQGKALTNTIERFHVKKYTIERLADCVQASNSPTVCVYQNKFLYKFGGNNSDGSLVQTIERYDISKNLWEQIDPKLDERELDRFQMLYQFAGSVQINENMIYIFGGYDQENRGTDFSFLLHIDTQDDQENTIVFSNEYILPTAEAFWNNQVIVYQRQIFVLQNIDVNGYIDEQRRRILCFDGQSWIDYGDGQTENLLQ